MSTNKGPAPGFINHPDHVVRIESTEKRWTVRDGDIVLADSRRTLVVEETGYSRVIYFPPEDVSTERLIQTEHRTTCPFKGEARYFIHAVAKNSQPLAWTYPSVFDEVAPIKGYIAFYENRVELQEESNGATGSEFH